jgi:hypothetical protein
MKDYYVWFLVIFILITACVVSYKRGYSDGYKFAGDAQRYNACSSPHDQNASDRPDGITTPQGSK